MEVKSFKRILNEPSNPIVDKSVNNKPMYPMIINSDTLAEFNYTPSNLVKPINLFIVWYNEQNMDRLREYIKCIEKNVANQYISKIYVMYEGDQKYKLKHPKVTVIKTDNRIMYQDAFSLINKYTGKDDINILANTDIFFDDSIKLVFDLVNKETVFCLTRWDILPEGGLKFHDRWDSQDVWVFNGEIRSKLRGDFHLGKPGCDNRLAHELKIAGYRIYNPSLSIKTFHLHMTNIRNYTQKTDRVPRPYETVSPIFISGVATINSKKNILHYGLNTKGQTSMCKALATMGNYTCVNWRDLKDQCQTEEQFKQSMVDVYVKTCPDFIFMQLQTPDIVTPAMIKQMTDINPNVVIMNWNGDIRTETPQWMIDLAKSSDNIHTAFTNNRDVDTVKQLGIKNVHYIQIGFEESTYNTDIMPKHGVPDIVFTGAFYENRFPLAPIRKQIFDKLKQEFYGKFEAYGGRWKWYGGQDAMSPFDTAGIYRSSKIAISINNINAHRYTSDRLFNIMATGTFALVHRCEGLELDFVDGKHVVYWDNLEQLTDLISQYLYIDIDKRQEIAKAGCEEVWKNHRWINRIHQIEQEILNWK